VSALALFLIDEEKKERTGHLDLGWCGLTETPEELFELTWLTSLHLCNIWYDWVKRELVESTNEGEPNQLAQKSLPSRLAEL